MALSRLSRLNGLTNRCRLDAPGHCMSSFINVRCNQNQGSTAARCGKRLVELHARHVGEMDIEYQTRVLVGNAGGLQGARTSNAVTLKSDTSNNLCSARSTEGSSSTKITSGLLLRTSSSTAANSVAKRSSSMDDEC